MDRRTSSYPDWAINNRLAGASDGVKYEWKRVSQVTEPEKTLYFIDNNRSGASLDFLVDSYIATRHGDNEGPPSFTGGAANVLYFSGNVIPRTLEELNKPNSWAQLQEGFTGVK